MSEDDAMQPLAGTKIVTIAFNLPGPAAVAQLERWGADVVKIEPPGGDPLARHCPDFYQHLLGRQQVVPLDLKDAADRPTLDHYLAEADLLVTSTLPISLERLGLAWQQLHSQFPRLCQVAIVGHAPPDEERTGHDLTYQAGVGLLSPPAMPLTLLADMAGAQTAVSHALAVLCERSRTGLGTLSYVAIAGALDIFTLPLRYGLTAPGGSLGGGVPFYNLYPTRQGWLAVAALEPQFWARLRSLTSATVGTYDEMKAIFMTRTADEWQHFGEQNRLPLAAVQAHKFG
ncbi:MAG TPA: CoA transferase [Pirellulales bacterium]|jgi:crotonobetainyl-CoA:carnitine CoA-transferase CaiB-like acyl-CoA transferase|nr:CoA transferase [Pirellulales bacterium]